MISKSYRAWMQTGLAAWALGMEATAVIGLRVAKAMSGGDVDGKEARLMVAEKKQATWELQTRLLSTPGTLAKREKDRSRGGYQTIHHNSGRDRDAATETADSDGSLAASTVSTPTLR